MNIYARYGDKVRFTGKDGYPHENQYANEILTVGGIYTIDHTNVHSSSTSIQLVEFPNEFFNSVMFEDHKPITIDERTFGSTPAAMYLARTLSEIGKPSLNRAIGSRISQTARNVKQLVSGYDARVLDPRVVAKLLCLMRDEVSSKAHPDEDDLSTRSPEALVFKLCRNVQIGHIKAGLRMCSVARKAERVMDKVRHIKNVDGATFHFRDSETGKLFLAGEKYYGHFLTNRPGIDEVSDITPELLNARSDARCKRLGKPHMKETS